MVFSAPYWYHDLLQLKAYLTQRFGIPVVLSTPTMRTDNHKARECIQELCSRMSKLAIPLIVNDNVTEECLGKGGKTPGLHLNPKGNARLAVNFISFLRRH